MEGESNGHLTAKQRADLELFREITQISDIDLCMEILGENRWNVESAVDSFVQGNSNRRNSANSNVPRPTSSSQRTNSASSQRSTHSTNSGGLIDRIVSPLKWLFQSRPVSLNPEADTRKFISEFDNTYGVIHPRLENTTYQQAVMQAFRASKFLLIYLHSPLHEDTNHFCRYSFHFLSIAIIAIKFLQHVD